MNKSLTIMNFSHVYEKQKFYKNKQVNWLDCSKIKGTNGYCDKEAFNSLEKRVQEFKPEGIHFIDSGNYHYATELWVNKIKRDFVMIVFDHHSDMTKPAFGDILSCGSWIMDELDNNEFLRKVIIIGLSEEQKRNIKGQYWDKLQCISEDDLLKSDTWEKIIDNNEQLPVYISIDKDVLNEKTVKTTWDQGKMSFDELKSLLHVIINKENVIGLDICGEAEADKLQHLNKNNEVNTELLEFLLAEKKLA